MIIRASPAADTLWRDYLKPPRRAKPRIAPVLEKISPTPVPGEIGGIAAWRLGEGPAILLVHGFGDDHTLWTPLMDRLIARGQAIVTLDLPAHGLSDGDEIALRLAADAVHAVAARLGPIAAIVGHSLGGLATALALSEGLTTERAVIIATARYRLSRIAEIAAQQDAGDAVVAEARALHAARFGTDDMAMGIPDFAAKIPVPALLIHSLDDERVPADASETAHALWRGSELWLTRGPDHRRTARDPAVIDRVLAYLG